MKKRMVKIISLLLIVFAAASLLGGCGKKDVKGTTSSEKKSFPVTITDVYDSKVTIEKKPERIVVLAPSTVEVLYKLGYGDKIVGVTEYCDYPAEAKTKNKVGDFSGINIEKIVEAKPDLVLASSSMSKDMFQKLNDLKIPTLVTEARTLSQIPESFVMIGKAIGEEDKAKSLGDEVTKKINEVKDKVKDAQRVKTYYVLSFGKAGNWTGGKGTFLSDLINLCGGENLADDVDSWKEYSTEKIVEKNPDLLLISGMVANGDKNILNNEKGYKDTSAVKKGSVVILDDNLTQRPGPRIIEGIDLIAKAIHPEIFK